MALRRRTSAVLFAVAVVSTAVLSLGMAAAQTEYPPSPPTTVLCTGGNVVAGTVALGETITITLCGPFQPESTESVAVGADSAARQVADSEGAITITVRAAKCASNTVVATGPGAVTATATSTGTFYVTCSPAPAARGPLAYTGANIIKMLVVAGVLMAIGALLLIGRRRRAG